MSQKSTTTRRFDVSPCVMLVALGDREAAICSDLLKQLPAAKGLQVMRVAHIQAACERMLVTRPLLVVFSSVLSAQDRKILTERTQDIMAEAVVLPDQIDPDTLKSELLAAVRRGKTK